MKYEPPSPKKCIQVTSKSLMYNRQQVPSTLSKPTNSTTTYITEAN